tara:strand:+ start:896 stop:1114 length:219 start_codon:yes stop_codon:yes gene_type:complete
MYNIDGNKDLARDPRTSSIVNVNDHDYEHYIASRHAKKVKRERTDNMEQDLANLKSEMSEIKSLLKELVHGN